MAESGTRMIIRPFRLGDGPGVRNVLLAAFPSSAEADLVEQLRSRRYSEIELVAEEGDAIVGQILFSRMDAPFRALGLAPVSVAPLRQRAGIGHLLIERGHELACAGGWEASFVLGDPAYYSRFGYSVDAAKPFECVYSGPHFMMLALTDPLAPPRGMVRYAPCFADLD